LVLVPRLFKEIMFHLIGFIFGFIQNFRDTH
jgi:hypothetical protein